MENAHMNRRSFIQGAVAASTIGGLTLVGCSPTATESQEKPAEETPQAPTVWVDAITSASVITDKYTNRTLEEIIPIINSFTAECVFSTVNEDGTPNLAVFAGGLATEDGYICFIWTDNQTKANIKRTGLAMAVFDVVNLAAEDKTLRHAGARLRLEYNDDPAVFEKIKKLNAQIPDGALVVKIAEVLAIG